MSAFTVVPDQFRHEIATAFNLKGKGLVLLTSCSDKARAEMPGKLLRSYTGTRFFFS
jgi:hypothetical protein